MNSLTRAYGIIKDRLDIGAWQLGDRLPSLAQMAKMCAVSRSTMWRVLGQLQKESLVGANRGGSIFAGPAGAVRSEPIHKGQIWERLKARIAQDILAGLFADNKLPLLNKLSIQYSVSILTLKKALHHLVREGLLITHGHRYEIAHSRVRRHLSSMMLISSGDAEGNIEIADARTRGVIESFERECLIQGYEYRSTGFYDRSENSIAKAQRRIGPGPSTAGFIVNLWNPWDAQLRKRWFDLIQFLAASGAPVIIIDQSGNLRVPAHLSSLPNLRVLRIAGVKAGEMVADALIRHGHRKIAYVAPNFNADWARNRYTGLCRHFEHYSKSKTSVELYARNEITDLSDLVIELLDLNKQEILALFSQRFDRTGIRNMLKVLERIKHHTLLSIPNGNLITATIRSDARHLAELGSRPHHPATFATLYEAMYDRASTYAYELYLQPFFEKVLRNSTASAWVCSDDKTAEPVIPFLVEHGKKVPEDISVIGYDNWQGDFSTGLSSYDFNMAGIIQHALRLIGNERDLKAKPFITEMEGYLFERRSIGKAKGL